MSPEICSHEEFLSKLHVANAAEQRVLLCRLCRLRSLQTQEAFQEFIYMDEGVNGGNSLIFILSFYLG